MNDQDSFADVCVRPHQHELLEYASRLCQGDRDHASDVLQDAMIRAMKAWPTFSPHFDVKLAVRGWLYRIVANTFAKSYHHDRVRRQPCETEPDTVRMYLHGRLEDDDLQVASGGTFGDEVREAISQLDSDHQAVVIRHYLRGQEYNVISKELGVPKGTVCSRLARARRILGPVLAEYAKSQYRLDGAGEDAPRRHVEPVVDVESESDGVDGVMGEDDSLAFDDIEQAPDHRAAG